MIRMPMRTTLSLSILAVALVLSACAPAAAPTATRVPVQERAPTAAAADTQQQSPSATPETRAGSERTLKYDAPPPLTIDPAASYTATMKTNKGDIVIKLLPSSAPKTVNNFVFLAEEGFYDGLIFHRVIERFMIQGGDPTGTGTSDAGYKFEDEIDPTLVFDRPGILAMANSGPNTNGSQFFITVVPYPSLNGGYTIFGQVLEGQEVADAISKVAKAPNDRPLEPVRIQSIEIAKSDG